MLLDDAAIVPVYQRGRAYLQRDSIKICTTINMVAI